MSRMRPARRLFLLVATSALALAAAPGLTASADGGTPDDSVTCFGPMPQITTPPGTPWAVNANLDCTVHEGTTEVATNPATPVAINGAPIGVCGTGAVQGGIIVYFGTEAYQANYVAPVVANAGPLLVTGGFDDDGGTAAGGGGVMTDFDGCCPVPVITCSVAVGGAGGPEIAFEVNYVHLP